MPEIMDDTTIAAAFAAAVSAHAGRPFLAVPANEDRAYLPSGFEMSYGEAGQRVEELAALYRQAGYGVGHRVATLLENRPEHVLHTLALNSIGVCCVPINPDYRAAEIAYLIDHSEPDLILTLGARQASIEEALAQSAHRPRVVVSERFTGSLGEGVATRHATRDPSPRRRPASCIPPARRAGPRAASCPMATRWRPAPGTPRSAAWPACARPRIASTIRCRSIMRTPASSR